MKLFICISELKNKMNILQKKKLMLYFHTRKTHTRNTHTRRIDRKKIITIGDNYNDMDMLRFSKTSIAMGNAPDEVKKCATFVTDTNNNDGIKKALVRIMDNQKC